MELSLNYTVLNECELFEINAGCWLCKLGSGLIMIGGILFALASSGILVFVGIVTAVVGGIFALIS